MLSHKFTKHKIIMKLRNISSMTLASFQNAPLKGRGIPLYMAYTQQIMREQSAHVLHNTMTSSRNCNSAKKKGKAQCHLRIFSS